MQKPTGITAGAALLGAVAAAMVRKRLTRFEIVDRSMSPALEPGDFVVALRRRTDPARGDVVVFPHPTRPGFDLVKRVIGLPGEHVEIAAGAVAIGSRILAEPWADGPTYPEGSWDLGPDEAFLLGDRRPDSSADSRTIGPVPIAALGWVVVLRYHPVRSAGRVR
jgi:signal peptidase I